MNKAHFIQQLIIRTCPGKDKIKPAIAHGEWLWAELTQAGYGDKAPAKPTGSRGIKEDSYSKLNERQLTWFDRFWKAFELKRGKQQAAQRWLELGEVSDDDYKKIVAAASKEARRDHGDITRMYAQGWLTNNRWMDYETEPAQRDQREYQKLNSELSGLKQLYQNSPNDSLKASIIKKEAELRNLREAHGPAPSA